MYMYTAGIYFKYYIFLYAHITLDERHHRIYFHTIKAYE